jgi:transposase
MDHVLSSRIYLCVSPCDMRKGFDTLAASVREFLGQDPMSGHFFIFVGRGRDRLKILYWDADGFVLWYKRLEEGTFKLPRVPEGESGSRQAGIELKASELAMMLDGIDLRSIKRSRRFSAAAKT